MIRNEPFVQKTLHLLTSSMLTGAGVASSSICLQEVFTNHQVFLFHYLGAAMRKDESAIVVQARVLVTSSMLFLLVDLNTQVVVMPTIFLGLELACGGVHAIL